MIWNISKILLPSTMRFITANEIIGTQQNEPLDWAFTNDLEIKFLRNCEYLLPMRGKELPKYADSYDA